MRKLKGEMRESKLFNTRIYPVVRLATKAPLLHVVEALTKSIDSRQSSLFHGHRVTTVTLIQISNKELLHKGWGLHVPRIKPSTPLHTKPVGRRLAGEPPRL